MPLLSFERMTWTLQFYVASTRGLLSTFKIKSYQNVKPLLLKGGALNVRIWKWLLEFLVKHRRIANLDAINLLTWNLDIL
jgi:hypothetical protein